MRFNLANDLFFFIQRKVEILADRFVDGFKLLGFKNVLLNFDPERVAQAAKEVEFPVRLKPAVAGSSLNHSLFIPVVKKEGNDFSVNRFGLFWDTLGMFIHSAKPHKGQRSNGCIEEWRAFDLSQEVLAIVFIANIAF